jgi:predicted ATPase
MVEPGADAQTVLLRWVATRRLLLIIDNAEVEPAVAALVSAILAAAPDARVLVTSRVRLQLAAECVFDLGGLSLPTGPEDLPGSGAGQLFLERARAARLQSPPGLDDYPHIVRICRLVNGLPLAIVLAAGRLRALDCAAIADELAHGLDLLVSDEADVPARQRRLDAAGPGIASPPRRPWSCGACPCSPTPLIARRPGRWAAARRRCWRP